MSGEHHINIYVQVNHGYLDRNFLLKIFVQVTHYHTINISIYNFSVTETERKSMFLFCLGNLKISPINKRYNVTAKLNHECGAEFV